MATPRSLAFLERHAWSLSLSLISALCFAHLASEIRGGELTPFDSAVRAAVVQWRGSVDGMMLALTRLGNPGPVLAFSIVVVATLAAFSRRREALYLALCASCTLLLNVGMKALFHRARPVAEAIYLLHVPTSFSFPSGHAMCSAGVFAGLAVVVQRLGRRRAWSHLASTCCVVLLLGVGASRVYFGVHFASDVLGGQLASIACVSALTGWFYPHESFGKRDQFAPELEYFSSCILEDRDPEPDAEEAIDDLRVVEAILHSARSGKCVPLEPRQRARRPNMSQESKKPAVGKEHPVNAPSPSLK